MNKGLLAHIISTILYIFCVLYVVGEEQTTINDRLLIVFFFICFQVITVIISDFNGFYKQSI